MNAATLEVVSAGALATIQDLGRGGWRRFGVPRAGALDPALLRIANALAGNDEGAASIEFLVAGPTFKAVDAPVKLGFAGDLSATAHAKRPPHPPTPRCHCQAAFRRARCLRR